MTDIMLFNSIIKEEAQGDEEDMTLFQQ